jgi:WD40 repeat protein
MFYFSTYFSHDNFKVSTDTTKAILSPDGRYACAGSQDGSIVVWNTENKHCENVLKRKHTYELLKIKFIFLSKFF